MFLLQSFKHVKPYRKPEKMKQFSNHSEGENPTELIIYVRRGGLGFDPGHFACISNKKEHKNLNFIIKYLFQFQNKKQKKCV